ncbi:MAG: thiol-disulfide oxidoreductase [Gallionellales bacterium GWA2_60_18]|nr:MAG: thiol-disulfide oxidoreductase [Gallionellales bacterium GWA2_60_18]
MSGERNKVTVYYDGACPICVRDRADYERLAGEGGKDVVWFDITGRDAELRALGIDPRKALTELHIMDGSGRILSEMDAYIVLMRRVPRLKLLAWFIGLPLLRPLLGKLYRWMVRRRLRRQGRL